MSLGFLTPALLQQAITVAEGEKLAAPWRKLLTSSKLCNWVAAATEAVAEESRGLVGLLTGGMPQDGSGVQEADQ